MKRRQVYVFILLITVPVGTMPQTILERTWVREYNDDFLQDAQSIVTDDIGNVYVGITSFDTLTDYGFTTVKFSPDGERLWVAKYEDDNPESNDYLKDIAVDQEGNVYITGTSQFIQLDPFLLYRFFVTIKYNSEGEQQWVATYGNENIKTSVPNHIFVDSLGYVYIQGNNGTGVLLKYDSSGDRLWDRSFINERVIGSYDRCAVIDRKTNIYTADNDFSVVKFDSSGNLLWSGEADSLENLNTTQSDITVDDAGNIYVCGTQSNDTNKLYLLAKYNNEGVLSWIRKYGGEINYDYRAKGIAIDDNGNIYVSGYVFAEFLDDDQFVTIKYDSAGNELWIKKFDGPPNTWGSIWNVGIDNLNNLYISGHVTNHLTNNIDLVIVEYGPDGNLLFSDYYGSTDRNEEAQKIAIDKNNNVFITGDSYSSRGQKVLILKYMQKPVSIKSIEYSESGSPVLNQNYPNPFNPSTTIEYALPKVSKIQCAIYNSIGQRIKTFNIPNQPAGNYNLTWNGKNDQEIDVPSGVYILYFSAESLEGDHEIFTKSMKTVLLK